MSGHTPGPWKWINYPDGRKLLAAPSQAVIHCPDAPIGMDLADASLIAAAPDLLAAVKGVDVLYAEMQAALPLIVNTPGFDAVIDAVGKARAAIAKAEGR